MADDEIHHPSVGLGDVDDRHIGRVSGQRGRDDVPVDPEEDDAAEPFGISGDQGVHVGPLV